MPFYRCQCEKVKIHRTLTPRSCEGCDKCGTRVQQQPIPNQDFESLEPHDLGGHVVHVDGHTYQKCRRCWYIGEIEDPNNLTRRLLFESAQWDHVARHKHIPEEGFGFFWRCDEPICQAIAEHLNIAGQDEIDPDSTFGAPEEWGEILMKTGVRSGRKNDA